MTAGNSLNFGPLYLSPTMAKGDPTANQRGVSVSRKGEVWDLDLDDEARTPEPFFNTRLPSLPTLQHYTESGVAADYGESPEVYKNFSVGGFGERPVKDSVSSDELPTEESASNTERHRASLTAAADAFVTADADRSKLLSYEEYCAMPQNTGRPEAALRKNFKNADHDGSGAVSLHKFLLTTFVDRIGLSSKVPELLALVCAVGILLVGAVARLAYLRIGAAARAKAAAAAKAEAMMASRAAAATKVAVELAAARAAAATARAAAQATAALAAAKDAAAALSAGASLTASNIERNARHTAVLLALVAAALLVRFVARQLDAARRGRMRLTFEQFGALPQHVGLTLSELALLFNEADADQSGRVDEAEFGQSTHLMTRRGQSARKRSPKRSPGPSPARRKSPAASPARRRAR